MSEAVPVCAASQPALPRVPALPFTPGCFSLIMEACGAGGRWFLPWESLARGGGLPRVPSPSCFTPVRCSGCRAPDTPCNPSRLPQLAPDLLCFKYRASRPLGGYLNPRGMPGILKRFYNIFLPSKLSWLLASAVKSSFSAVSCHLHAEGG